MSSNELEYYKSLALQLKEENIKLKCMYNHVSIKASLPIEIINDILCYAVDYDNYMNLLLLSKDLYNYFKKYIKKLLARIRPCDKIYMQYRNSHWG